MSSPRPSSNPNTKINNIRENVNSEYAEELKLNIRCDEDYNHVAVLYCPNCLANLCTSCSDRIHSMKALSKHEVVRLTQKPEPPIYCYLHPQKTAELVCKEPKCRGINQPMCTICHLQETHKNHKYELIGNEYNRVRTNITNCLEEIETKRTTCDKNVKEYDRCISTYSSNNAGFWKTERDKIDKFYSDARALALKTFDDFANNRIKTLKSLKNQYINDRTSLDNMGSELRNIEEMKKLEVIKSGENVEKMMIKAGRNIDEPTDLIPSKSYNITYPDFQLMNLRINYSTNSLKIDGILKAPDVSRNVRTKSQQKTPAVYFSNFASVFPNDVLKSKEVLTIEDKDTGKLYNYKDDRSILCLNRPINNSTIDVSQYKYIAVIDCWPELEEESKNILKEQIKTNRWSKIAVFIYVYNWKNNKDFVKRIQEIAKTDKLVVVMIYNKTQQIFDYILES